MSTGGHWACSMLRASWRRGGVLGRLIRLFNFRLYLSHGIVHSSTTTVSLFSLMSTILSTSNSHSSFASFLNAALETYKRRTKTDLAAHSLLSSIESCDSPEAILSFLREQIPTSSRSRNIDDGLTKWVSPTVNVMYAFSATVGQGVGLVTIRYFLVENFCSNIYFQAFPPANAIFAGIGVLLMVGVLHLSLLNLLTHNLGG